MRFTLLRYLILGLPVLCAYLAFSTGDYFYYILCAVSLLFSVFVVFPSFLAVSGFSFPRFGGRSGRNVPVQSDGRKRSWWGRIAEIPFYIPILAFVLLCAGGAYISLYSLGSYSHSSIFVGFFLAYYQLAVNNLPYAIGIGVGIFVVTLLLYVVFNFRSLRRIGWFVLKSLVFSVVLSSLALVVSYFVLYGYAVVRFNQEATALSDSRLDATILLSKDKIVGKIKTLREPPHIVLSDKPMGQMIVYYLVTKGVDSKSFYGGQILTHMPPSLLGTTKSIADSQVLVDSTLFIQSLEKADIEAISPSLGKLLVKHYFSDRYIKDEPSVSVLGRQEYLKFREDQINEQLAKIQELVDKVQKNLTIVGGNISTDKSKIASNQDGITKATSSRDSDDKLCRSVMGYDYDGNVVRYYSDQECDRVRDEWNGVISQLSKNLADWQKQLSYDQNQWAQYTEAKKTIEQIKSFVASQKSSTPQELGVFTPETDIKLALDSTDKKMLHEYAVTLVHEYLHYTSYVTKERQLPRFFEEGLTEYYARKVISKELTTDTNIGYPLLVKVIQQMASKLPEQQLEDIYFTKDVDRLQSLLDQAYGKNFYNDSEFYFTAMSYVSSKDALKFANNVMLKIGGKELTEKDLYSDGK
jgi:hypothetical protein